MKIGCGVTTYNRPKHLELWTEQIEKYCGLNKELIYCDSEIKVRVPVSTLYNMAIFIANDSKERRGIAYRKNECLKALSDCDYIFLFDDDCFPVKNGWADFFIDAHKHSGQHHFMYLKETPGIKKIESIPVSTKIEGKECFDIRHRIESFDNCGGCFMFLTKEVIEKVGGYCYDYGYYGYEHAGYSERIHRAGLTPLGKYTCPAGAGEYIYAMDYDFHRRDEFQKKVNHRPSMSPKEMIEEQQKNYSIYLKESQHIFQPL